MAGHEKAAYMAGIMDGEGSFSIYKVILPAKRTPFTHNFLLFCGFTMTDVRVGRWALENFGGHFNKQKYNKAKPWHKDAWRWRIGSGKRSKLEAFLLTIIPYLILKREQAELMLDFCRLPHGATAEKQAIMEKVQFLNRRGKSPEANTPDTFDSFKGISQAVIDGDVKIESELAGDRKSDTEVIQ